MTVMPSSEKVNVLIVDDLPDKVLALRTVLEELGENIIPAYSGNEALRKALEQDFAVILLDINMPDMDGLETAAMIRRRRRSAHTPIIFVTAYADEVHTSQAYSLGAVDFILAPVIPEVLRSKVRVFVELFRLNQQIKQQAEQQVALAQEQALRAAAEEATRRSTFLAEASKALTRTLDFQATLREMLRWVVPQLADVAAVTLAGPPARAWHSELAWVFPPDAKLHRGSLASADAPDDVLRTAVDLVLASGEMERLDNLAVPYPPPALAGEHPAGPEHVIRSATIFPLLARGKTLGALTLAMSCSGRRHGPADLSLAEDVVTRAASAADNALLYQSIQEADRRKNEFLAMLGHELRNPLAPIRNAVGMIRLLGLKDPLLLQARDMIDRQVTHMTRLIDDLLDMSRISRGRILLRKETLDLVQLVAAVMEDYRGSLETGGLKVHVALPDTPLWVEADATRMAQVVGNVVHNARKFTDAGGAITVSLDAPEPGRARLRVRDTGIGMDALMLERAFEAFSQADRSLDRTQGGLGLGLALVKGLMDLHGGTVDAHSAGLGHGTEVAITLPLTEAPAGAAAAMPPRRPGAAAHRVLIIEDNRDAAQSMEMLLTLLGHRVTVAYTGQEGVARARDFAPDVILCDIGLPGGMDGLDVARTLRKELGSKGAYLVALTGYGQEIDKQRSREAGFDIHLTKPIDLQELQAVFATLPVRN